MRLENGNSLKILVKKNCKTETPALRFTGKPKVKVDCGDERGAVSIYVSHNGRSFDFVKKENIGGKLQFFDSVMDYTYFKLRFNSSKDMQCIITWS